MMKCQRETAKQAIKPNYYYIIDTDINMACYSRLEDYGWCLTLLMNIQPLRLAHNHNIFTTCTLSLLI